MGNIRVTGQTIYEKIDPRISRPQTLNLKKNYKKPWLIREYIRYTFFEIGCLFFEQEFFRNFFPHFFLFFEAF